jgi:hypothetical protein
MASLLLAKIACFLSWAVFIGRAFPEMKLVEALLPGRRYPLCVVPTAFAEFLLVEFSSARIGPWPICTIQGSIIFVMGYLHSTLWRRVTSR